MPNSEDNSKTLTPYSNSKFNSPNEWVTTIIFLTWHRNFATKKVNIVFNDTCNENYRILGIFTDILFDTCICIFLFINYCVLLIR